MTSIYAMEEWERERESDQEKLEASAQSDLHCIQFHIEVVCLSFDFIQTESNAIITIRRNEWMNEIGIEKGKRKFKDWLETIEWIESNCLRFKILTDGDILWPSLLDYWNKHYLCENGKNLKQENKLYRGFWDNRRDCREKKNLKIFRNRHNWRWWWWCSVSMYPLSMRTLIRLLNCYRPIKTN